MENKATKKMRVVEFSEDYFKNTVELVGPKDAVSQFNRLMKMSCQVLRDSPSAWGNEEASAYQTAWLIGRWMLLNKPRLMPWESIFFMKNFKVPTVGYGPQALAWRLAQEEVEMLP